MSDTKDETGSEPTQEPATPEAAGPDAEGATPEVDLEALAEEEGDAEEDGLDLSDLDAYGVEGVVARLSSEGDEPSMPRARPARSPVVSLVVLVAGSLLLVSMFADFRYWTRSSEPVELGHASTLLQDGRTLDAYENQYVALEGTPDVQNAARLTTKERYIGYLRVTEGEGGLFAKVPRTKDQPVQNNFEGRYVGRLRRLRDDRAYEWLREFYATQQITREVELDPKAALPALGSERLPAADGSTVPAGEGSILRLVFDGPDARLQLGRSSFPTPEAAEQAVAALGVPYLRLPDNASFHRFVARIPEAERAKAHQALNAGLEGVEGSTDPKVGAFVLALPMSYGVPAALVTVDGDDIVFPYGDNTTTPGYDVKDGRLVEREAGDELRMPVAQLRSLRLERPIEVDPDGFVVSVDEVPGDSLMWGVLWLLLMGLMLVNVVSLVVWWRNRSAAAAA
ncbi:MAG: hypothetical protein H6712_14825 [Myxococcales bacterium]|nr:hypothetical protein [Myxococcales bacterium]MCB9715138.1 hypothetical protein [Myxococcales bacterium]